MNSDTQDGNVETENGLEARNDLEVLTMSSRLCSLLFFDSSDPKYSEEKPFFSNIPFLNSQSGNSNVETHKIEIPLFNVRGFESQLDIDKNGFELVHWNHDFTDLGASVTEKAYPAIGKLLRRRLGDDIRVVVFDHTLRRGRTATGDATSGHPEHIKAKDTYFGRPSTVAHSDQTYDGTVEQIRKDFGPQADALLSGRFRVINVWKPLKTPVVQSPLVFCDSRTCMGDGHGCDLIYPHSISENLIFSYSRRQRWYYIDEQRDDETWLLKIMDSASLDNSDIAQYAAHTSFYDLNPALVDETRESIEFRAYVFG